MNCLRLLKRVFVRLVVDHNPPPNYPYSLGLTKCRILDSLREMEPQTAQMLTDAQPDVTTVNQHLPMMVEAGLLKRYRGRMKFGNTRTTWLYVRTEAARAYGHRAKR